MKNSEAGLLLKRFDKSLEAEWDHFVEKVSLNGTFLNTRKFYNHNPLNEADDHSLLIYRDKKLISVIAFNLFTTGKTKILQSYLRATYGGIIVSDKVGVQEAIEIVQMIIEEAKSLEINEIIIRNPFRFLHKNYCDETDYAMWVHGFAIKYRELESVVKLDKHTAERYQNGAKYNIKKAWKTVTVKETELYDEFWNLLTQNLNEKHNSKPTHDIIAFHTLKDSVGSGKIKLFGGFVDEKLVCGVVVFLFEPTAIHAQYIASDFNYQDMRPLNAVIDFIINWGRQNSYQYFNLGMASEENGTKINYGLYHFKEGFGSRGALRETLHLLLN